MNAEIFVLMRLYLFEEGQLHNLYWYYLKAACLILCVWLIFDLINFLYSLALICIECLFPLVTQGLIFCFSIFLLVFFTGASMWRVFEKSKLTSVFPIAKDQSISSMSLLKASVLKFFNPYVEFGYHFCQWHFLGNF